MPDKKILDFTGYSRRLDIFAADELPQFSRSIVQKMIKDGKITVNGKKVKPSWPLQEGERVEIELPRAQEKSNKLAQLIIADGKDYFVINKPAGMLVHPQSPVWETNPEAAFASEETLVPAGLCCWPKTKHFSRP